MLLILKFVAFAGLNLAPIAKILPGKILIQMLEVSIAQTFGSKILDTITSELDGRMKEMVTGDRNYQFGDITSKALTGKKGYRFGDITRKALTGDKDYQFGDITRKAVLGKKDYEFGDLTRTAFAKLSGKQGAESSSNEKPKAKTTTDKPSSGDAMDAIVVTPDALDALVKWDQKYLLSSSTADSKDDDPTQEALLVTKEIQQWDEELRQSSKKE